MKRSEGIRILIGSVTGWSSNIAISAILTMICASTFFQPNNSKFYTGSVFVLYKMITENSLHDFGSHDLELDWYSEPPKSPNVRSSIAIESFIVTSPFYLQRIWRIVLHTSCASRFSWLIFFQTLPKIFIQIRSRHASLSVRSWCWWWCFAHLMALLHFVAFYISYVCRDIEQILSSWGLSTAHTLLMILNSSALPPIVLPLLHTAWSSILHNSLQLMTHAALCNELMRWVLCAHVHTRIMQ